MKTTKDTKRGTAKRPAAKKTKATARTAAKSGETARDRNAPYIKFSKEELARGAECITVGEYEDERAKLLAEQERELRHAHLTKPELDELADWLRREIKHAQSDEYAPYVFYDDKPLGLAGIIFKPVNDVLATPGKPRRMKLVKSCRTMSGKLKWFIDADIDKLGFEKFLDVGETVDVEAAKAGYHVFCPLTEELRVNYLYEARTELRRLLADYFTARAAQVVRTNTKAADLWLSAADVLTSGGKWKGEATEAARLGRIDHERGKLAGAVAPSPSSASAPVAGSAAEPRKRGRPKNPNGRSGYRPSADRLAVGIAIMEEYRRDPGAKWAEAVATCEKRDGKRYDWYAVDKNATRWANYNGTDRTWLRALSAADWEKQKAELK